MEKEDENTVITIKMPRARDFWIGLLTGLGLAGGAWLIANEIKRKTKTIYSCPNCDTILNKGVERCPNKSCNIVLDWKPINEKQDE
jgi:hypothetical protein